MPLHASANMGRNDPCPCGSGKKYKRCCQNAVDTLDRPWREQRNASARLSQALMRFARDCPNANILDAWLDFNQDESPLPIDEDPAESQIFVPYFLFDWDPEPSHPRTRPPRAGRLARTYLAEHRNDLSELELLILNQATTQPLSFYEVLRSDPGNGLRLRDVFIGEETEVIEHAGSETLRSGDIAYGQLCRLPGMVTMGRMAPHVIPPRSKAAIVQLRAKLRKKIARQNRDLGAADLIRYREEIRTAYLDLRDGMRRPPVLTNTDGDPFLLHTLTFRVGSAHAAFEALAPLARGFSKEELLETAEFRANGELLRVEIQWLKHGNKMHKDWENTILAHIKISCRSMVVDVNSENRASRIRQEIEHRLGILVVHEKTVIQNPATMPGKRKRGRSAEAEPAPMSEMNEEVRAVFQQQVENWIHQKVPLLGGRTPLEAVGDADGKEIVESLLLDWERSNETITDPQAFRPDVNGLRRLLKLTPSNATLISR